jgi:RNase H-like domain found in reverse transcriptase
LRTLKVAERKYSTSKRELLAIETGINFNIHLLNSSESELSIYCDYANLSNIAKFKIRKMRHFNWFNIFESVKYLMLYVAGNENLVADFLAQPNPCDAKKKLNAGRKTGCLFA